MPKSKSRLSAYCRVLSLLLLPWLVCASEAAEEGLPTLNITGANAELERNIRAHVSLTGLDCATPIARLNRLLPEMRQNLLRASRALGYYRMESEITLEQSATCWTLNMQLEPGLRVTVSDINIAIISSENLFGSLYDNLSMRVGDPLNHAAYEQIKSDLSGLAVEQGFFAARFASSQLQLDLQANSASVDIEFDPGERFRFGAIMIDPIAELSDEFIRRYIEFSADTYYSASALLELRNALNNSQYFSEVSVTPSLSEAENQRIPIQVVLRTRPRRVYSAGTGVTTDIGPRLRLDYEDRYLNPSGHKFEVKSGASPIQQNIDLNYSIPMSKPATESLQISSGFLREDNDTYQNKTTKLGVTYSTINRFNWRQNLFTNYQHDDYTLNDEREIADILLGGLNLSRTRANDALFPTKGWRLFGQISGASADLLSTTTFLQLNLAGKLIQGIGVGRVLLKFEAGTTLVDDFADLPVSLKYFSGGDQSVRGYRYQSLGPLNADGEVEGGKHVLSAGIEYDFPVANNWKMAVFTDAGNAFDNWNDYRLNKSVGVGIRWLSPIGPIRFDLASALDNDNKLRLHITMGPDL
jgi:translocation and assembly module TamA